MPDWSRRARRMRAHGARRLGSVPRMPRRATTATPGDRRAPAGGAEEDSQQYYLPTHVGVHNAPAARIETDARSLPCEVHLAQVVAKLARARMNGKPEVIWLGLPRRVTNTAPEPWQAAPPT